MNRLEVHHIFPKSQLYKYKYNRTEVNALANFCFLTKNTNLSISIVFLRSIFRRLRRSIPVL